MMDDHYLKDDLTNFISIVIMNCIIHAKRIILNSNENAYSYPSRQM